ncbi:hypothetical protein PtA15_18A312 [Puccinia triticina]|uniref:Uncharacterized protein n=1 Tax=Puccinia triticina TaxID=208348 RepID=A0ABY7D6H1_9BASI|nr:uncharacterized protein PtA15_18A312 [Puccinia triticina]WAQ93254.1 hypothetical protein PtA15_18A312 [Puccinia triticina]
MRKESEKLNTSLPIKRTLVPDPFPTPEGLNPGKRITGQQANPRSAQPAPAISQSQKVTSAHPNPNNLPAKPKESRSKGPGYQGKNFLPNYAELKATNQLPKQSGSGNNGP